MRRLSSAYQDPEVAPKLPFQHLKTAAIAHYDSRGECSSDWAFLFLTIPSLRTFAAEHMAGYGPGSLVRNAHLAEGAAPRSDVRGLFFTACGFEIRCLEALLAGIKALEKFTYTAGGYMVSDSLYEPKLVIHTLATHVGRSLVELCSIKIWNMRM
jgi:hypothetical protein